MKPNNLIIKLILLFTFATSGWGAVSYGVSSSTVSSGESFSVYCNLDADAPSGYKIKVKFSSGITFYKPLSGGPKNWSRSYNFSNTGSYTVYFALFNDTELVNEFGSKTFTVEESTLNAPTGISASDGSYDDKVKITWNSVSGVTNYKIYRSQYSSSGYEYISSDSSSPYYDYSATQGITYYYKIKSYSSSLGNSEFSSYNSGYAKNSETLSIPSTPSKPNASDGTYSNKIQIVWDSVAGATEYKLYRNHIYLGRISSTSYDDYNAVKGEIYYYELRACNDSGCSTYYSSRDNGYISEIVDTKPTITINTLGTENDNVVTHTDVLSVNLTLKADSGLKRVAYGLYKVGTTNIRLSGYIDLSGKEATETFNIGITSLENYSYKVKFLVTDVNNNVSSNAWYWFDKGSSEDEETKLFKQEFSTYDTLVSNMLSDKNIETKVSRAEAVILVEKFLSQKSSAFKAKDMGEYYIPFADVDEKADYVGSLLKLSYYVGDVDTTTPISKENKLFRPLDMVTRQEFIALVVQGLDLPIDTGNSYIENFDDYNSGTIADWAYKYFNTAVKYNLMSGNDNKLLPQDDLSVYEALVILGATKKELEGKYKHTEAKFESPDSLKTEELLYKSIGFEYEPQYYESSATPIDIKIVAKSSASKAFCGADNSILLSVGSSTDSTSKVSEYYWWNTNAGYFREYKGSENFKKVCFYPATKKPADGYTIVVQGGDNLGFVDKFVYTGLDANTIHANEDTSSIVSFTNTFNIVHADSNMKANQVYDVRVSGGFEKEGIDAGIEDVTVNLVHGSSRTLLYKGQVIDNEVVFLAPDLPELYGKTINLEVIARTQNQEKVKNISVKYLPTFSILGKIYNANSTDKADYITIGSINVYLDENNEFYYLHDTTNEVKDLKLTVHSSSNKNSFESSTIDLTYANPQRSVIFVGEDSTITDVIEDNDSDGDGVIDSEDAFPNDSSESIDTDKDGIGNNADKDDDNDKINDDDELRYGLDPLDATDALKDNDSDGKTNKQEIIDGTNPNGSSLTASIDTLQSFDFNRDGISDILFVNDKGYLKTWELDNSFKNVQQRWLVSLGSNDWEIYKNELNPENALGVSILLQSKSKGYIKAITMNGFTKNKDQWIGNPGSADWKIVGLGANKSDIILQQSSTGYIKAYIQNNSTKKWAAKWVGNPGADWQVCTVESDDYSDKTNIIFQHKSKGYIKAFVLGSTLKPTPKWIGNPGVDWKVVKVTDLDNDNIIDVIFEHKSKGYIKAFKLNSSLKGSAKWIGNSGSSDWKIIDAADIDGDGKKDILVQSKSKGYVKAFKLNNDLKGTAKWIGNPGSSIWKVSKLEDLDKDGKADIVFEDTTKGYVKAFKIDASFKGQAKWIGNAGTGWKMEMINLESTSTEGEEQEDTSNGTITHKGISYGTVKSPNTGRIWLDRNLGASQACTALDDEKCYGDYYQWGRNTDGHEKVDSKKTTIVATSLNNAGSKFIISEYKDDFDWLKDIDNVRSVRNKNWAKTDGSSICPKSYRVPTIAELEYETINASQAIKNEKDAFNSFLKLPSAGIVLDDYVNNDFFGTSLWSNSFSSPYSYSLRYSSSTTGINENDSPMYGFPIRCINAEKGKLNNTNLSEKDIVLSKNSFTIKVGDTEDKKVTWNTSLSVISLNVVRDGARKANIGYMNISEREVMLYAYSDLIGEKSIVYLDFTVMDPATNKQVVIQKTLNITMN